MIEPLADDRRRCARAAQRLFPPTLVIDPPDDAEVMRHEIFGPILPVLGYRDARRGDRATSTPMSDRWRCIRSRTTPTLERILDRTLSGGVTVNDTLLHFGVHDLPFGGIGPSGIGAIHGKAGFDAFSKLLPVFRQSRWAASDWIKPPYRGRIDRLVRCLAR